MRPPPLEVVATPDRGRGDGADGRRTEFPSVTGRYSGQPWLAAVVTTAGMTSELPMLVSSTAFKSCDRLPRVATKLGLISFDLPAGSR